MSITKEIAQRQLEHWLIADEKVAKNQSYTIGTRSYTRADAAIITEKINYWSDKVLELSGAKGRRRITRLIPS